MIGIHLSEEGLRQGMANPYLKGRGPGIKCTKKCEPVPKSTRGHVLRRRLHRILNLSLMSEAAFRIVLTTTGTPESAQRIARALVERRLAACVNIIPAVTSIYHWRGAVESASELLLVIKTEEDQLQQLEVALRELHSYELPEFLVLPVAAGSKSYLEWIHSSLGPEIPDSE